LVLFVFMSTPNKKVTIIGVLMDLGADRRGVDMGPSAVRDADLSERLIELGYDVTDEGNIVVRNPEIMQITDRKLKYLPEIVIACQKLADEVEVALEEGSIPSSLAGIIRSRSAACQDLPLFTANVAIELVSSGSMPTET
jgi:arginase family enzyme